MTAGLEVLAVDLGGTSMRAALTGADGSIRARVERDTPDTDDPRPLIALAGEVLAAAGRVDRAVVGVPGRVDYADGRLEHAPNLPPGWDENLTADGLARALGLDVALANDADLAAVGEAWFGAGRSHRDVAYLTVSTGVGAGVVTAGLLVHGCRSMAEVGHTVIDRRALAEGRPATVEELGSGTALGRLASEAGIGDDGREVVARSRRGDAQATEILDRVVGAAALGAVTLAHLFAPEVLVVGGGLGLVGDVVLEPVRRLVAELGPRRLPEPIGVVSAELGDDAALAGAGAWHRAFNPQAASRRPGVGSGR